MLILTRKLGEGVIIGDNVRVVVLEVRGKQIRLGIEAPTEVVVLRDEIFQRLTEENLQAARFLYSDLAELKKLTAGSKITGAPSPEPPAAANGIALESPKLGPVKIPREQIITFHRGLLGMGECRQYALLAPPLASPFRFLQCLDQTALTLVLVEPSALVDDFRLGRLSVALRELDAERPQDLQVFVTLTIPPGRPDEVTANLISPILINPQRHLGKQVVLESPLYSHKHRFLAD